MDFQASVVAWFTVQLLSDSPVGGRFGLAKDLRIKKLQCETGDALDDLVVHLEDDSIIYTECKTRPGFYRDIAAPMGIGKVLRQLVELYFQPDSTDKSVRSKVALLAVSNKAPSTMDDLNDACRQFDYGGTWNDIFKDAKEKRKKALGIFKEQTEKAASNIGGRKLTDDDLARLARLFHVSRFPEDGEDPGWHTAYYQLGQRLYGDDRAGAAPMKTLLEQSRKLIKSGAPAERWGLLRALRNEGHVDVAVPGYNKDINALIAHSDEERVHRRKHMYLSHGANTTVHRECLAPLLQEVKNGSLLVTGEPGAGKTGVLLALAECLAGDSKPLLFLSVERFSGVRLLSDLRSEIKLKHDLTDILAAWPGVEPGVLIVDALDASRGGESESVFAKLIMDAVRKAGDRWSVVASIRSFDLQNSRRFQEIMRGVPADQRFVEKDMGDVRHFRVPRLSSGEIKDLTKKVPEIGEMIEIAPQKLRQLLHNIFNLSLAMELLKSDIEIQSIKSISTQYELIKKYEDYRLPSHSLKLAVKATVSCMISHGKPVVRDTDIEHNSVDEVCKAGILIHHGDRIAFAHHILFDYAAGRFYLSWDKMDALGKQFSDDISTALMLGPALRFTFERIWRENEADRGRIWRFLVDIGKDPNPSPIMVSVALRSIAEQVDEPSDVDGLWDITGIAETNTKVAQLLSLLARFLSVVSAANRGEMTASAALAWAIAAKRLAENADNHLRDAARCLLIVLIDEAAVDNADVLNALGEASRSLLDTSWSLNPENPFWPRFGIRFVAKTYKTNPDASSDLLKRVLEDRFDKYAPLEVPRLAEDISYIFPYDGAFAARIYDTVFSRDVTDETDTWFGGYPSSLLPIISTNRQEYGHARWFLIEVLEDFLKTDPAYGTTAVIHAVRGLEANKKAHQKTVLTAIPDLSISVIDDFLSLKEWRGATAKAETPLAVFEKFLQTCDRKTFRCAVATARDQQTNASIWGRILGIAADRPGLADDLLWPLVNNPRFVSLRSVFRDAVFFIAAAYKKQSLDSRETFEMSMLRKAYSSDDAEGRRWRSILARILSTTNQKLLATPEMKMLRTEMDAAGELVGNPPSASSWASAKWTSDSDFPYIPSQVENTTPEDGRDDKIHTAIKKVKDQLKTVPEKEGSIRIKVLWTGIEELAGLLDARKGDGPDSRIMRSGWGAVSNGVEHIAKSKSYDPRVLGQPDLSALLILIDRLFEDPFPKVPDNSQSPSRVIWHDEDVRVYAASSLVALALRFGGEQINFTDRLLASLNDNAPSVRAQIVFSLRDAALKVKQMQLLMEHIVANEKHDEVLAIFVAEALRPLSEKDPQSGARMLSKIIKGKQAMTESELRRSRNQTMEAVGELISYLCLVKDQPEAWTWIDQWSTDLQRYEGYLVQALQSLQHVLFLPYNGTPTSEQLDHASRGWRILNTVLIAATSVPHPHAPSTGDETVSVPRQSQYASAGRVITAICNELYFGSGASKGLSGRSRKTGLDNIDSKQRFVSNHVKVLCAIGLHGPPGAIYHLIDLLDCLTASEPKKVFDVAAEILLGPAVQKVYKFEPMAIGNVVKLIRRYLADHMDIFDNHDRRENLVKVLNSFALAGWPETLKLLFDLPEILR